MRWCTHLPGGQAGPVEPGANSSRRAGERFPATRVVAFDIAEVDDGCRPRARLWELELASFGLEIPRMPLFGDPTVTSMRTTPARGRYVAVAFVRSPNASTSRPSGPATRVCVSSATRWTMQSPGPTSYVLPSCHESPEPARTKKISSSSSSTWTGEERPPGSSRNLAAPTPTDSAASPRSIRSSCIGPRRRSRTSTSSQWTTPFTRAPRSGCPGRPPRVRGGRSPRGARGRRRRWQSGCPPAARPCSQNTFARRERGSPPR